jgi:uncharacterized protein DUF6714
MSTTASIALDQFKQAFSNRQQPARRTDSNELTPDELNSLERVFAEPWDQVTAEDWESLSEVVSFFSPEAFCYYLPGILSTSIKTENPNLSSAISVFMSLDRTPEFSLWDDFFQARWRLLSEAELNAVREWINWLCKSDSFTFDEASLTRAMLNVDLLKTLDADTAAYSSRNA